MMWPFVKIVGLEKNCVEAGLYRDDGFPRLQRYRPSLTLTLDDTVAIDENHRRRWHCQIVLGWQSRPKYREHAMPRNDQTFCIRGKR